MQNLTVANPIRCQDWTLVSAPSFLAGFVKRDRDQLFHLDCLLVYKCQSIQERRDFSDPRSRVNAVIANRAFGTTLAASASKKQGFFPVCLFSWFPSFAFNITVPFHFKCQTLL